MFCSYFLFPFFQLSFLLGFWLGVPGGASACRSSPAGCHRPTRHRPCSAATRFSCVGRRGDASKNIKTSVYVRALSLSLSQSKITLKIETIYNQPCKTMIKHHENHEKQHLAASKQQVAPVPNLHTTLIALSSVSFQNRPRKSIILHAFRTLC